MTPAARPSVTPAPLMALQVENLTGPAAAPVVHDVAMSVPMGRKHVVLGPIHAGKTMLLRHIVGLECAASGTATVGGERFRLTGEARDALRRMRTRLGVVFEGSALFSRLSALENVELPLLEHMNDDEVDPDAIRQTARELLAEVGLGAVDDEVLPEQLGRAAQRRVALARAMALRPPVLLLDEPTAGLDAHAAAELDETVLALQQRHGFGIVVFSHEVRHAYGAAEYLYILADGRVVADGPRESLMTHGHPAVQRLLQRRGRRP